MFFYEKAVS